MLCPTPPKRPHSSDADRIALRHRNAVERHLGSDRLLRAAERIAGGDIKYIEIRDQRKKTTITNPFRAFFEQREKERRMIDERWHQRDEQQGKAAYKYEKADRIRRSLAERDAFINWKDQVRMKRIWDSEKVREDLEKKQARESYLKETRWRRDEIRNREIRFLQTMRTEKETRERYKLEKQSMRESTELLSGQWNSWKMLLEEAASGYQTSRVLEAQTRDRLEQEKLEALRREESWNRGNREKYHKEKVAPKAKKSRARFVPTYKRPAHNSKRTSSRKKLRS